MAANKTLVARLTLKHADGFKMLIELHTDAGFNQFYRCYRQDGRKRKVFTRFDVRQYGIGEARDLDVMAAMRMKTNPQLSGPVIKIYKKREYKRLLTCAPDQLTGGLPNAGQHVAEGHHWDKTPVPSWINTTVRRREAALIGVRS